MQKRITSGYILVVFFVGLFSVLCLYPFLLVISGSLTTRAAATSGFTLIPKEFTLEAYRILFSNSRAIVNAYRVTIAVTVVGTVLSLIVNSMLAFALSRRNLPGRKAINIYVLITMLFSGGMVPW
jgi:putative aldouronate transport system permease protein